MIKFYMFFNGVVDSLSRLLEMEFVPGSSDNKKAVGRALESILGYHFSGNVLARDTMLGSMALLAKNLREIQEFDPGLLQHFKKFIKSSNKVDDFFGMRFEINIAATLIRNDLKFKKSESPDFLIDGLNGMAAIECSSARIREERKDRKHNDLSYKIKRAVQNKSKKKYSNLHTALFLDVTNLVYNTSIAGLALNNLLDKENLFGLLEASNFGNLTIFSYRLITGTGDYESVYTRVDHSHIEKPLVSILDDCFPFGIVPLNQFAVPEEG